MNQQNLMSKIAKMEKELAEMKQQVKKVSY